MSKYSIPKIACLVSAVFLCSCGDQTLQEGEFAVGKRKIEIPEPNGYVRIDGINAKYDQIVTSALPSTNKLVSFYGTEKDRSNLKAGREVNARRNFNVQSINAHMDCSEADFVTVKSVTEQSLQNEVDGLNKLLEEGTKNASDLLSDLSNDKVALSLGKPVPLGILDKGDTWLTFAMKIPMEYKTGSGTEKVVSTSVNSLVLVNNKVLGLYGTHIDGGDDAVDKLKADLDAWRAAVFEANR